MFELTDYPPLSTNRPRRVALIYADRPGVDRPSLLHETKVYFSTGHTAPCRLVPSACLQRGRCFPQLLHLLVCVVLSLFWEPIFPMHLILPMAHDIMVQVILGLITSGGLHHVQQVQALTSSGWCHPCLLAVLFLMHEDRRTEIIELRGCFMRDSSDQWLLHKPPVAPLSQLIRQAPTSPATWLPMSPPAGPWSSSQVHTHTCVS